MARMQCPGFVRLITRYRRAEHAGKHVERGFDNGSYDYRYCQCRYPSRILRYRWHAHQFHDPYGAGFHNRGDSPAAGRRRQGADLHGPRAFTDARGAGYHAGDVRWRGGVQWAVLF